MSVIKCIACTKLVAPGDLVGSHGPFGISLCTPCLEDYLSRLANEKEG